MREIKLYTGGGVSISPTPREGSVESDYVRIVADDGYAITNGTATTTVIDVLKSEKSNWSDCDLPPLPPDPEPEPTEQDYATVGRILMGVTE